MLTGTLSPVSRRATFAETFLLYDALSGDPIDLTGAEIRAEFSEIGPRGNPDYGPLPRGAPGIVLTIGSGIDVPDAGVIALRIEAGELCCFGCGAVLLSIFVTRDGDTDEIACFTLPIGG